MNTTRKVAIGIGIAGGAILAAWLFTGSRKKRTKDFLVRRAHEIKKSLKKADTPTEDSEVHYV
jgi:F0F1-type ATP synthase membrane subunit b/b'